jgi:NADH dehydrogenase
MYLVAGASTVTGRALVERLLRKRLPVRVLVRRDADAGHFAGLGAEVVQADVRDAAAVGRAARGVTTLVSLIGRHFARTEAGLWDVEVGGNETLIRAAREARVGHFVLLSVLWADRDPGPVIFRAKRRAEDLLRQSGLRSTILRPSMFVLGPNSLVGILGPFIERCGVAVVPAPDSKPISFLTTTDLADALLAAALARDTDSRVYELGGPEALTLAEAARRIGDVLHRRPTLVPVPRPALRALRTPSRLLGFGAYEALLFFEMLAEHGFACAGGPAATRRLLGREPQSVESALRDYYAGRARTPWSESVYGTLLLRAT